MSTYSEIYSDKPISSCEQDVLGRSSFVEALSAALTSYTNPDSLVIGLMGPWGGGKSSILNCLKEKITISRSADSPILFSFNPWIFSSHEDLITLFIKELGLALGQRDYAEISKKLYSFSKILQEIPELPFLPLWGSLKYILKFFSIPTKWLNKHYSSKTLLAKKDEIDKLLRKSKKKIIIIIDDVDRLSPEETNSIFRLVKAVCDFSNTIYIVAFDKDVVINSLNSFHNQNGAGYIEKIIQVPFELPSINSQNLYAIFFQNLTQMFGENPFANDDESYYWNIAFQEGITPYLKTPRDINRLINTFRLAHGLVQGEVNWVDFLVLECLKVFNTGLYTEIRDNPDYYTGVYDGNDSNKKQKYREYFDRILASNPGPKQEKTKQLLIHLFPSAKMTYNNYFFGESKLIECRKALRLCSQEIFPVYFQLDFHDSFIKKSDIDRLIKSSYSSGSFSNTFFEVARVDSLNNRINQLLDILDNYTEEFKENSLHAIDSLFRIGEELERKTNFAPQSDFIGTGSKIRRLLFWLLKNYKDSDRIYAILQSNLLTCPSLSFIIDEVHALTKDGGTRFPDPQQNLTAQHCASLVKSALEKIELAAKNNNLHNNLHLLSILHRWKEWSNDDESIKQWFQNTAYDPDLFTELLNNITSKKHTSSGGPFKTTYYISYTTIAEFIDPKSIKDSLEKVLHLGILPPQTQEATLYLLNEINNPNAQGLDLED